MCGRAPTFKIVPICLYIVITKYTPTKNDKPKKRLLNNNNITCIDILMGTYILVFELKKLEILLFAPNYEQEKRIAQLKIFMY